MSPARTKAKTLLKEAFAASGVTKADLARKAGLFPVQIDRVFDLGHASTFDQLDRVAKAMGKRLAYEWVDA